MRAVALGRKQEVKYYEIMTAEGRLVMNISIDDAIDIYAKASRSWYGTAAVRRTEQQIERFRKSGDLEGVRVWERLKRAIKEQEIAQHQALATGEHRKWA